jgi:hypothetical protein
VSPEYSTGNKHKLLGIPKRENDYLRKLLVHVARANGQDGFTLLIQTGDTVFGNDPMLMEDPNRVGVEPSRTKTLLQA